ncbi:hypothetical protein B6U91_01010 [Candidatus Pacearchaeota archaeon ex4484_71]|nr:MAG: hypothetical protein B6U91_01010 [Candidatus Pacearchaeota archaeon ex4484_71]
MDGKSLWSKVLREVEEIEGKIDLFEKDKAIKELIETIMEQTYGNTWEKSEGENYLSHSRAIGILEIVKQEYFDRYVRPLLKKQRAKV